MLAHALLGRVPAGVTDSAVVDLDRLLRDLEANVPGGIAAIRADLVARGVSRLPAHPVPAELASGLSAAQLAAAYNALQERMGLSQPHRVVGDRPLDAHEQRLSADRPPHHG